MARQLLADGQEGAGESGGFTALFLLTATDGKACPDWAPHRMRDRLYDMNLPRDDLFALGEHSCLRPAIMPRSQL